MRATMLILEELDVDARKLHAQLHHPCFEPGVLACVPTLGPQEVGWEGIAGNASLVGKADARLACNWG